MAKSTNFSQLLLRSQEVLRILSIRRWLSFDACMYNNFRQGLALAKIKLCGVPGLELGQGGEQRSRLWCLNDFIYGPNQAEVNWNHKGNICRIFLFPPGYNPLKWKEATEDTHRVMEVEMEPKQTCRKLTQLWREQWWRETILSGQCSTISREKKRAHGELSKHLQTWLGIQSRGRK